MFEKYKLKYGETLEEVADRYGTTEDYLKEINNIYFNEYLKPDMDIIIPKKYDDYYTFYTIKKGDTLYQLSKKFNVNLKLLSSLNGLEDDDYIYTGQEILMPKKGYSYYITKEGDTIKTVLDTFNISKEKFDKYNRVIYLLPGQLLVNKNE